MEYHEITQSGQSLSEREFEQIRLTSKTGNTSKHGDVSVAENIKVADLHVYRALYLTQSNYLAQCSYKATRCMSETTTKAFFLLQSVQTECGVHPAYSADMKGKVVRLWS
jgi:hypothetical protein